MAYSQVLHELKTKFHMIPEEELEDIYCNGVMRVGMRIGIGIGFTAGLGCGIILTILLRFLWITPL